MIRACFGVVPPSVEGRFDLVFGVSRENVGPSLFLGGIPLDYMSGVIQTYLVDRGGFLCMSATDVLIDEHTINSDPEYYLQCAKSLAHAKRCVASHFGTSTRDAFLGFVRAWENLPWLLANAKPLGCGNGAAPYRNTACHSLVVASGPSLDFFLSAPPLSQFSRALNDREMLLLIADSAVVRFRSMPRVARRYMLAVERTNAVEKYFSDENLLAVDGVIVSSYLSAQCMSQLEKHKHRLEIFWAPQTSNLMRSFFHGGCLDYGKSVASLGAAFSYEIGRSPIFVGLDLAYGASESTHASGIVTGQRTKQESNDNIIVDEVSTTGTWVTLGNDIARICWGRDAFRVTPAIGRVLDVPGLQKPNFDALLSRNYERAICPQLLFKKEDSPSRESFARTTALVRVAIERAASVADMLEIPDYCLVLGDILAPAIVPLANLSQFKASEDFAFQKLRALSLSTCDKIEAFLLGG